MRIAALIAIIATLSGCMSLPDTRLFEREVPDPVTVTPAQRDAWAQAADYLAVTIETPAEAITVADALSDGIGAPIEPVITPEEAVAAVRKEYRAERKRGDRVTSFLEDYQGEAIKGTGFNVLWLGAVGFVVLLFAFPPLASLVWFLARRGVSAAQSFQRTVVSSIDAFRDEHPDEAQALLEKLSKAMDAKDKLAVHKIRKTR